MRRGLGFVTAAGIAAGMAVFGLAPAASAATDVTLYASPSGSTTADCLSAATVCSLSTAIGKANADNNGDTVVLAGGGYSGVALTLTGSMSLTAAPGQSPVLAGTGANNPSTITINSGTVSISGLTVTSGNAGIQTGSAAGPLTVTGSTINSNGIGILAVGNLTVTGSTISNNNGGIELTGAGATVTDSTITGNPGAGITVGAFSSLTTVGVTISGNQYGISDVGPGGEVLNLGSTVITATRQGCASPSTVSVTDAGYNVESDNTCGLSSTTSKVNAANINLGPLAANGSSGPQTQAIGTNSDD